MFKKLSLFLISNLITVFLYAQLDVIPQPNATTYNSGDFTINSKTVVISASSQYIKETKALTEYFKTTFDLSIKTGLKPSGSNQIILKENSGLGEEEYIITSNKKNIICEASTPAGMFYAMQTLIQAFDNSEKKHTIAAMTLRDSPRYAWRGLMLDESRHFFGKEVVKQLLDVMAYLKMNRFHWHLTDEPGWRIEIKKYPKLTEIGAEGNWHDSKAPRKFYTQDEVREIVAYASERHIMVIPEIDMPGHAIAANRAYPEFSAGGTGRWKDFTFHPTRETTYKFIDDVLTEVAQLFPAPYIHIGGDEVHYGNQIWFTDPEIQQFIKDNDLKNEVGLEHYFVRRACDIVNSKDRIMIGWDEIIASGVTPNKAVVMWWRHDKPDQLVAALEKGFDVIMTPRIPCYFDFVQHESHKIGRRWSGTFNTMQTIYSFPDNLSNLITNHTNKIWGMQASLWTERIADVNRLNFMLFPRLAGIAENAWTNPKSKDYSRFEKNIKNFLRYLDKKGINYFNLFEPESTPEPWGPDKADIIAEG